jgi:phosphoglycerate-specific signal transduction histidine kinase
MRALQLLSGFGPFQVILDPSSALKELVENSVDAGATKIEVRLREFGLECIEVVDNGKGIKPEDYALLATKHTTSKLMDFGFDPADSLAHSEQCRMPLRVAQMGCNLGDAVPTTRA